jgi:TRAP-type C4-dicarboxylate transport system permease small subunit
VSTASASVPPAQPPLLRAYDTLLSWIDRIVSFMIIVAMAVLTIVICAQVFFRYVLNSSIDWSWDVPRLCFIWMGLLAIPLGLKRHAHVGIDLLIGLFPRPYQKLVIRINVLLMIVMMAVVGFYGARLARTTWPQLLTTIDVSVGVLYIALVICSIHCILHLVRQFIDVPEVGAIEGDLE